jgi:hypothetical protein
MNRNVIAVTSVLAAAGGATGIVAAANAQDAPAAVEITASPKSATVKGAEALKAGPTKFLVKATGKAELGLIVFKLKPGVTRDQIREATPKIENPSDADRYGSFVASTFVPGGRSYSTTVNLAPAEYAVIDFSKEKAAFRTTFTVGQEQSNAVAPTPVAKIEMDDYKFNGPSTLPRTGVVQVDNTGKKLHHTLVFPLANRKTGRRILANLRKGKEPSEKSFAGPPSALVEIVSPGTSNAVDAKLRRGTNLLVCFVSDGPRKPPHAALGMAKLVTVR